MPRRRAQTELPEIVWRDGVHLAGSLLWFDAPRRHHLSLVSDARVRLGRPGKVLATPATSALLGLRERDAPLLGEYGHPLALGPLRIELVPSGSMVGGAQAAVETERGRLLYAGAVAPAGTATAPPAGLRSCDVLVLAAPRDLAQPPRARALADLTGALEQALAADRQPVVLAESPGPAQDLMVELAARFPLCAHRDLLAHARAYGRLGIVLPRVRSFRGRLPRGAVLLWPPAGRGARALAALEARQIFSAPEPTDLAALIGFVETVAPRRVHVTGARASDLSAELRRRGCDARPLAPAQMKLF